MELNSDDTKFLAGVLLEHLVQLKADTQEHRKRLSRDPGMFSYLASVVERGDRDAVRVEAIWRRMLKG